MCSYSLTHVSDRDLLRDSVALATQESASTARLLAHIGEIDARRLYLPAGYSSMFAYSVQELHLSEDAAYRRIQAARSARQFPAVFVALAEGRLHLSAVLLLGPHLTPENAEDLLGAAARKSKSEIELLLAERFPRAELLPMMRALPASAPRPNEQLAPERVEVDRAANVRVLTDQLAPERVAAPAPRSKLKPVAPQRYELQVMFDQSAHDDLQYLRTLLSHQVPSGDLAQVLGRAMRLAIGQLEKQKCSATSKPRHSPRRSSTNPRHIPARVKRAVWERDQGQCTFEGESGHRCGARKFLEFDHVDPVARGGQATVENVRLRCRGHNQHEADCAFGAGFMIDKREAARRAAAEAHAQAAAAAAQVAEAERAAAAAAAAQVAEAERLMNADVIACMRTLGYRADESRRAAAFSATKAGASLEERVRLALSYFRPKARSYNPAVTSRGERAVARASESHEMARSVAG